MTRQPRHPADITTLKPSLWSLWSHRWRRCSRWIGRVAARLPHALWRSASWVFRSRWRLLVTGWLVGFFLIGQATLALGDDGLISGPDLGSAGGQTVFEQYGPERFSLYLQLSDSNHGAPYISQSMWEFLRTIESALLYLVDALARGAITSMEWLLNLHLYADNATLIDSAVRAVAAQVFWPLFGATLAVGAFSAYARMKREGGGSLFTDAAWLVAASVFAGAFAIAPSATMSDLDGLRTDMATAAMTGYASSGPAGTSAAGFPAISLPTDQAGATRRLADAMWNVYVVTPWCYVNFNSMSICADVGHDYLTGDHRWQALADWMAGKNGGNSDDTNPPYCPKELTAQCDWIRGQSFGRLGATIFVVFTTVPLVIMLLALVLYGIMAVVGFLLLILVGVFFVLGWMIPGPLRQMGVRWFEEVLGSLIQSVIITAVLGSVMVLDAILDAGIPHYGFFMVGLLNLASFVVGFRMRGRLENITGLGAGGSASPFSGYLAMSAVAGLGRGAMRLSRDTIDGAVSATPILAAAGLGAARFGGQLGAAGIRGGSAAAHALKTLPDNLLPLRPTGGHTPPQHHPTTGTRRPVLQPTPRSGGAGGAAGRGLPPGPQTLRGRSLALDAPGISQQTVGDRRVFVAAGTPAPQRTFQPSGDGPRARARGRLDQTFGVAGPHSPPFRFSLTRSSRLPHARSYGTPTPASPASQAGRASAETAGRAVYVAPPIRTGRPPPGNVPPSVNPDQTPQRTPPQRPTPPGGTDGHRPGAAPTGSAAPKPTPAPGADTAAARNTPPRKPPNGQRPATRSGSAAPTPTQAPGSDTGARKTAPPKPPAGPPPPGRPAPPGTGHPDPPAPPATR